ncbi:WbqC family protein (plasmid) [Hymenobacter tibetensis]|uniref:WbqC family protein n=1 Tax=Hymenobacter tibetensis TaxID=497967 RepID=A0ABY4D534_9BACT|nr:WbqC family protein [Hymenobacter tibetensis]UOG77616.1 WbqC family protein [Hymenobacter tibetensis]
MQPYLFPYLGYFQLIAAVDKFILLDDVQYINKGWINRNRMLIHNTIIAFTIPLKKASQNRLIKDIEISFESKWQDKLLKTIESGYKKAPYFKEVFPLVYQVLTADETHISGLVYNSLLRVLGYLGINTEIKASSVIYATNHLRAQEKILNICLQENAQVYINPIGGSSLYEKALFEQHGIHLLFLDPVLPAYQQFSAIPVSGLSILDVLMHNSADQINQMLLQYRLV